MRSKREFASIAAWMAHTGLNDQQAADVLKLDRTEVTRLRNGKRYRCLLTPLRVSNTTGVPIEKLAADDAA